MAQTQILVVEDESIVALDIRRRLIRLGYAVPALAASGAEAIDQAARTRPDLVLMDIKLEGDMDGIEAAECIRARFDLPIIYLTAYADANTMQRARFSQPYSYLLKPFEERELQTNIEMALYRHQLEQRLKQSEQWLGATLNSIGDAIIATDDQGRIKFMNPVAERLTGWSQAESLGKNLDDVFQTLNSSTRAPRINPVRQVLNEGRVIELAGPVLLVAKTGSEIFVEDNIAPIKNEQGHITGVVLVFRDITERRQLDKKHRQLSAAIEQTAESVIITDPDGAILYVNPAFEQITGYSRAEVIGQTPRLLKSDRHSPAFYEELWSTIKQGRVWRGRFINRKKDGALYTDEATIAPVFNERGAIVNYVSVRRDVTRELQLEEQSHQVQKMEAVGLLAGGIAHDFNNILTVINGYTELMLAQLPLDSPLQEKMGSVLHAGKRAADLVRQLLAFSRKQMIQPEVLNLNGLVMDLMTLLKRVISENIHSETKLDPDLWPLKVDPHQIEQIILNLAVNAQDAMPDGGSLILETANVVLTSEEVAGYPEVEPGEFVLLTIGDTGMGMAEEVKTRIFEPFFTTKELGRGTGLGLAMVYGIVKQNKGHIWVYSKENEGTTFRIYLPRAATPPVASPETGEQGEISPRGSETILLVEDEQPVREFVAVVLREHGYRVIEATHGHEALLLAQAYPHEIHLLLTDMVMPGISGTVLAQRLVQDRPQLKVLIMSGYSNHLITNPDTPKSKLPFIQKPFTRKALLSKVREPLDKNGH
ncbi:MAG: PAS domain S-box protein [Chloroflexota bacterium]